MLFTMLILLATAVAVGVSAAHAGTPGVPARGQHPQAEQLTQSLVALNAQYHLADPAARGQLHANLLGVAQTRHQLLLSLVEQDPAVVLRVALPPGLRQSLPPAVQALVEEEVELEGDLEVLHEDWAAGSRYVYVLDVGGRRLALHFAADPPHDLLTGTRVRVKGVQVGEALALQSGQSSVQALASVLPNTFGEQRTVVILVTFQNNPTQPYTPAYAQGLVFGTTSDWDWENSYQQTWLTGDVVGWFTIALSSTVCDYNTLASQADQAATAAGVTLSSYSRRVYAFPQNACSWWGLGTVGGNPSRSWINGSLQLRVVAHEMGHNFGLWHSHALECGTTVLGPGCSSIEYGDTVDVMGATSGHFNAFQKERLGWLAYGSSPPIDTIGIDGTYWVDRYETLGATTKALKILKSTDAQTGKKTWYYVEYRQAVGFDGFLAGNGNVLNGVVLHTGSESSGDTSYLLDLTPATSSWNDPALVVGQSFSDPDAGVTITAVSSDGTSAAVSVSFAPVPCVPASPTVALSPSQSQWVRAGTPVAYTVSVTNRDNASCPPATFALGASVPSGWGATFGSAALSLDPGATASTTLTVTSPAAAAEGFYTVGATATNTTTSSLGASASGTYVVVNDLDVAVATDKAAYQRNQTVTITATVSNGTAPAAGASVTFRVTKPNGSVVTSTGTTGSAGTATYKLRLKRNDPTGTYQIRVDATVSGAISGTGTRTFTVQ
jgi:hypothetical protein